MYVCMSVCMLCMDVCVLYIYVFVYVCMPVLWICLYVWRKGGMDGWMEVCVEVQVCIFVRM